MVGIGEKREGDQEEWRYCGLKELRSKHERENRRKNGGTVVGEKRKPEE